jgi:hypothetical protein
MEATLVIRMEKTRIRIIVIIPATVCDWLIEPPGSEFPEGDGKFMPLFTCRISGLSVRRL